MLKCEGESLSRRQGKSKCCNLKKIAFFMGAFFKKPFCFPLLRVPGSILNETQAALTLPQEGSTQD